MTCLGIQGVAVVKTKYSGALKTKVLLGCVQNQGEVWVSDKLAVLRKVRVTNFVYQQISKICIISLLKVSKSQ